MSYLRHRYKSCFIGEFGSGKTSFILSVLGRPIDKVKTTLGIDFFTQTVTVENMTAYVTLWDTAGAERYRSLMHSYIRDSDIVFIIYDITDIDAMASVRRCLRDIEGFSPTVVAVVGTKSDLGKCSHDVHDAIESWKHNSWTLITGTCSSLRPETTRNIFKRCLSLLVKPSKPVQISPVTIHVRPVTPEQQKCCT